MSEPKDVGAARFTLGDKSRTLKPDGGVLHTLKIEHGGWALVSWTPRDPNVTIRIDALSLTPSEARVLANRLLLCAADAESGTFRAV